VKTRLSRREGHGQRKGRSVEEEEEEEEEEEDDDDDS
jgi:hypothetical protein